MAENQSGAVDIERLQTAYYDLVDHSKFQSTIEETADKLYVVINLQDESKKPLGNILVRRLVHEEAMRIFRLPFYAKLVAGQKLDESEERALIAFELEMVIDAIQDKGKWVPLIEKNEQLILYLFNILLKLSGMDKDFTIRLESFLNSESGFAYGYIWFFVMGKTPSEIAKLPETDVIVVNTWASKWMERVNRQNVK